MDFDPNHPGRETPAAVNESEEERTSSGCLGILLEIASWVFSTVMITVGAFLLVFGVLDFSPEERLRTIVLLVLIPVSIFALVRIGRNILRDLRGK